MRRTPSIKLVEPMKSATNWLVGALVDFVRSVHLKYSPATHDCDAIGQCMLSIWSWVTYRVVMPNSALQPLELRTHAFAQFRSRDC